MTGEYSEDASLYAKRRGEVVDELKGSFLSRL